MFGFHGFGILPFGRIALIPSLGSGAKRIYAYLFPPKEEKRIELLKERSVEIEVSRRIYVEKRDGIWKLLKELSDTSEEYLRLNRELADLIEAINRLERRENRIKVYIRRNEEEAEKRVIFAEVEIKRKIIEEEEALLLLLSHA